MEPQELKSSDEIAWCPGCGNFGILNAVKKAITESGRSKEEMLLVSGIGQAAKLPHYIKCNCFNGLHGRALPVASAAKIANRDLTVLVHSGDGDCYGEGGNHFIHNIRRNIDMTLIVHNNQIYGLTKGQASPTTEEGFVTKVQTEGVLLEKFHSLRIALSLGCGFVSRGFTKRIPHLASLIQRAMAYKGFALVEVLQPCVSFNSLNTYKWYSDRVYDVNEETEHDPEDESKAYKVAGQWGDRIPIGVLYEKEKPDFSEKAGLNEKKALVDMDIRNIDINRALQDYKTG